MNTEKEVKAYININPKNEIVTYIDSWGREYVMLYLNDKDKSSNWKEAKIIYQSNIKK